MHKPILIQELSLSFQQKSCFSDFSQQILPGSRIAILGRNGVGKSTLLKIIQGSWSGYEGDIHIPADLVIGYLPQLIETEDGKSGAERLNSALTAALCQNPNCLLLDEPTNHLDRRNRRALMRHLQHFSGTLITVTHDLELLRNSVDTLWHIHNGRIDVFHGSYADYQRQLSQASAALQADLTALQQQKRQAHDSRMREQVRGKQLRNRGEKSIEQRKWPTIRSASKMGRSVQTADKRVQQIQSQQALLQGKMAGLYQNEILLPDFQLSSNSHKHAALMIQNAALHFASGKPLLQKIDFHLRPKERVALVGDNGSGKTSFIKAILGNTDLIRQGDWQLPQPQQIGYLDQHYQNLPADKTAMEILTERLPNADRMAIRKHLNDFLFRKNEEVEIAVRYLSGGEKARLSLCCIAAQPPGLLILDEMSNNLDLETREHVIQVLQAYPGSMIVVSHDEDFLQAIQVDSLYRIHQGTLQWQAPPFFEEYN